MRGMKYIFLSITAALFITLALSSGCSPQEPIKIGYIGELSGSRVSPNLPVFRGAELAIALWNERGGIDGRRIELIKADDKGEPAIAYTKVQELIDQGIIAMIGPTLSSTASEVLDLVNREKVVTITPSATANSLHKDDDYFFTIYGSNSQRAAALARFALDELQVESIGVILDETNAAYTENYLESFAKAVPGEIQVIDVLRFSSSSGYSSYRFEPMMKQMVRNDPDSVLILGSSLDTARVVQQLYKLSLEVPILISEWAVNRELIEQGGPFTEYCYFSEIDRTGSTIESGDKIGIEFYDRYGIEISSGAVIGYESADILCRAIERSMQEKIPLERVIPEASFQTEKGKLSFSKEGNAQRSFTIRTINDGTFVDVQ
jgi:branched-chain amino acid transport system substrate-binding protein